MRLTSNGRLGIGTSSPDHLFEVEDNNSSIATVELVLMHNFYLNQIVLLSVGKYKYQNLLVVELCNSLLRLLLAPLQNISV
ncbi:MAG: hypothetical protein CM15mV31_0490 [uncultured marine virus]|nr:MAG: hypothetical protein CM15mV31_0490 [uncultured marine virus]